MWVAAWMPTPFGWMWKCAVSRRITMTIIYCLFVQEICRHPSLRVPDASGSSGCCYSMICAFMNVKTASWERATALRQHLPSKIMQPLKKTFIKRKKNVSFCIRADGIVDSLITHIFIVRSDVQRIIKNEIFISHCVCYDWFIFMRSMLVLFIELTCGISGHFCLDTIAWNWQWEYEIDSKKQNQNKMGKT